MKGKLFFVTLLTCLLMILTTNAQVKSKSFNLLLKALLDGDTPTINVPEAANDFRSFLFLDAREKEEYEVSHVKGARHVGHQNFQLSAVAGIPKDTPLVVYCSIGKRSDAITAQLVKAGYTRAYNLYGGLFEWVNQGHPVYTGNSQRTEKVHAYNRFWGRWLQKGKKVY